MQIGIFWPFSFFSKINNFKFFLSLITPNWIWFQFFLPFYANIKKESLLVSLDKIQQFGLYHKLYIRVSWAGWVTLSGMIVFVVVSKVVATKYSTQGPWLLRISVVRLSLVHHWDPQEPRTLICMIFFIVVPKVVATKNSAQGPWLLWISEVRFSLVCVFKK